MGALQMYIDDDDDDDDDDDEPAFSSPCPQPGSGDRKSSISDG